MSLVAPSVGPPRNKDLVHVLLVQGSVLWCMTSMCGLSFGSSAINTGTVCVQRANRALPEQLGRYPALK